MAGFGEPIDWTNARSQEAAQYFPTLQWTEPDTNMEVDAEMFDNGDYPSEFSQSAMNLAGYGASRINQSRQPQQQEEPGFFGKLFGFLAEVDKPLSQRLGFKAEGEGVAPSVANIAMEEATRPSNIILSLGGLVTGGLTTEAAGARAVASAAARLAARNVATNIGVRIAATGAEKGLEELGVENPMVRGAVGLGAGFIGGGVASRSWANVFKSGIQDAEQNIIRSGMTGEEISSTLQRARTSPVMSEADAARLAYGMTTGETTPLSSALSEFESAATRAPLSAREVLQQEPNFGRIMSQQQPGVYRPFDAESAATNIIAKQRQDVVSGLAPKFSGVDIPFTENSQKALYEVGENLINDNKSSNFDNIVSWLKSQPEFAGMSEDDIFSRARQFAVRTQYDIKKDQVPALRELTRFDWFKNILNIPIHLRSTLDLSSARQLETMMLAHPGMAKNAFVSEVKALGSEEGFVNHLVGIRSSPNASIYKKAGVEFGDLLDSREEAISSNILAKIPVVGKLIRPTDRAYTAAINQSRADLMDFFIDKINKLPTEQAQQILSDPTEMQRIGKFVMAATGRGSLPQFLSENKVLGLPVFWAPRLLASRVQIPLTAIFGGNEFVRNEARRQLVTMAGANIGALTALKSLGVADVETDPRSSDFGKIKIGERRFDTLGGYGPIFSLFTRLGYNAYGEASGQDIPNIKTTPGPNEETDLYGKTSMQVIGNFLRSKLSPIPAEALNQIYGQDFTGQRLAKPWSAARVRDAAINLLAPLAAEQWAQELYNQVPEAAKQDGALGAFKQLGATTAANFVYMNGIGGAYYLPRPADLAAMGKYKELSGEDQLDAIRAASWASVKNSFGAGNYKSYRGWQDAMTKEYQKNYEAAGFEPALAAQMAASRVNNMYLSRNYQNISRMYETQWILDNKDLARKIANEEMNKPYNQRRLSLTQQQLRLLQ
jgi:hypothetical protein